jgi:hypothetical protein
LLKVFSKTIEFEENGIEIDTAYKENMGDKI